MATELRRYLQTKIRQWTLARQRRAPSHTLTQNRIFILPTKAGCAWLLLLLMLLVMAINYENNLIYAVTFLLLGVFLTAIFHTYANLAGIEVKALPSRPCFAGRQAEFELELQRHSTRCFEQLHLRLESSEETQVVDLLNDRQRVRLYCPAPRRGWLSPGGVKLETCYPLGLFRAWSWLNLEIKTLVYPELLVTPLPSSLQEPSAKGCDRMSTRSGDDDFAGLERFQAGMSPRQVDWKSYARGRGLHAKHFAGHQDPDLWLDLDAMGGEALERRLSRLAAWVEALSVREVRFGLRLGSFSLAPAMGESHRSRSLAALALYGLEDRE
ncbi:Uncharacterized conserved protein, DUF58 family, contains vWF domain [Marinobacterium sediminicola]|uniref:Uncharacterized conserved protein, DUF58 family, contains vWF domain n=1 Tax=Marinobacterium sediminicola TaxID=518898 RepID=A0ABY1RX58_9GAMM|nr:Uncharacterized conserved protein, DUF58 family, contains vWF domain [Marinobacterium sediminicola]